MPGYFLEPHAPGVLLVGRDPHSLARYPRKPETSRIRLLLAVVYLRLVPPLLVRLLWL